MNLAQTLSGTLVRGGTWLLSHTYPKPHELGTRLPPVPDGARGSVVLVNGVGCSDRLWEPFASSLRQDGFAVSLASLPDHALGNLADDAAVLRSDVESAQAANGGAKVAVVGYGAGGLIARDYIENHDGADAVSALVMIGTPNHGVVAPKPVAWATSHWPLRSATPEAFEQLNAGSDYIRGFAPTAPENGVAYTSIRTQGTDGLVSPADSPILEGADNIEVPQTRWLPSLPSHLAVIQRNNAVYEATRGALLSALVNASADEQLDTAEDH